VISGWQRQAQLGDGDLAVRRTIAKAFGLDDATLLPLSMDLFSGLCGCPDQQPSSYRLRVVV